jgi:DNA-binding NtrC family response regulator
MTRPKSVSPIADDGSSAAPLADNGRRIIGSSPALLAALERARALAESDIPILIIGETGTGKELVARYVHRLSGRSAFMDIDCGTLPEHLAESLLFGHTKGAFTGAVTPWTGLIGLADGGTLLLDELASLPVRGQAKLLRVLETAEVRRVGGGRSQRVDFRVVSTAREDLSDCVERGDFRLDLLQRVAGAVIRVPPLAERQGDVIPLARSFAAEVQGVLRPDAETLLADHVWAGNVRELRWTVLRACHLCPGRPVTLATLVQALAMGPAALFREAPDREADRVSRLRAACRAHRGDPSEIAQTLGVARSTVYKRARKAGLMLSDFREGGRSTS